MRKNLEPPVVRSADLRASAAPPPWLWPGFLAGGDLTLLTSLWKAGKTTLLSLLLARRRAGGTLLGRPVSPGRTAVVTEEPQSHWERRHARLDFGDGVWFMCRPFAGLPTPEEWQGLVGMLGRLHAEQGVDLAVIDPLAAFLPAHAEGNATLLLEALLPLRGLSERGPAVLALHHPRKGAPAPGQAARGSGALSGYADVLIEMRLADAKSVEDRRRRFRSWSRHAEAPAELVAELNEAGTDYELVVEEAADGLERNWPVLRGVFEEALRRLTRQQVLAQWPPDHPRPGQVTLWRWLEEATARGSLCRDGRGTRMEPFRYWLAGKETEWAADPLYDEHSEEMDWLREVGRRAARQATEQEPERPRKRKRRAR